MSRKLGQYLKILAPFHTYLRNLLIIFSGSTVAEFIPLLSAPILTRVYNPSDFGHYGFVISLAVLYGQFSTLRYENSIVISKEPHEVLTSLKLCEYLSIFFHFILFLFCFFYLRSNYPMFLDTCLLILLASFGGIFFRLQVLLANREGRFKQVSMVRVVQAFLIAFLSIVFGLIPIVSNGLIWALLISNMGSSLYLRFFKTTKGSVTKNDLFSNLKRYKNFLFCSLPAELINVGSARYPLLVFPILMGETVGGFLALAYRVVAMPARFIANAVGEIFFQSARKEMMDHKECRSLFLFTASLLGFLGAIGFGTLFFSSDFIFTFIFGEEWKETASFVKLLIPLFLTNFVVSPLSSMIYVAEKQSWDLLWQTSYFFIAVGGSLLSWFLVKDAKIVLLCFVLSSTGMYVIYFFMLFTLATRGSMFPLQRVEFKR